jgi:hypothetical protein
MPELLELQADLDGHADTTGSAGGALLAPTTETDERALRRMLRDEIASLNAQLDQLFCTTFPREGFDWGVGAPRGGPRILPLVELERVRDRLAARLDENAVALDRRTREEERNRGRIEHMLLEPARHKWEIISNEDIGEPGCRHWHVRPRYGVLGMFLNWWRVRISSGCPLAGGRGPSAVTPSSPHRSR